MYRQKVHFAPFRASAELALKDLLSRPPDLLIIDVAAFEAFAFNPSHCIMNMDNKPQIILMASCNEVAGLQPIMETGICALLVKPWRLKNYKKPSTGVLLFAEKNLLRQNRRILIV